MWKNNHNSEIRYSAINQKFGHLIGALNSEHTAAAGEVPGW